MHKHEYNALREASGGDEAPRRKMRPRDAALYLGTAESTLAKWRLRGDGPPYSKCGPRLIIYDVADMDAWLAGRKRSSTSEDGGACVRSSKRPGRDRRLLPLNSGDVEQRGAAV